MLSLATWKNSVPNISIRNVIKFGAITSIIFSSQLFAANGKPFEELQIQIDDHSAQLDQLNAQLSQLEEQVDEQLLSTVPVEVSVDCGAGENLQDVIDQYRNGLAPLTVNITGVCPSIAIILRDNVTLQGVSPGAGIDFSSNIFGAITVSRGAKNVELHDLTITGTGIGVLVTKTSQIAIYDTVVDVTSTGILALDGSHIDITGTTITNGTTALFANRNGTINISDSLIDNNQNGFVATAGGVVNSYTFDPVGTNVAGVTVNVIGIGGLAQYGGIILTNQVQINAGSIGLYIVSSGMSQSNNTSITSSAYGAWAQKNTSVLFGNGNEFNNSFIGVNCHPDASLQVSGPPGTLPGTMNGVGIPVSPNCEGFN